MQRKPVYAGLSAIPARRGFVLATVLPLCIAAANAREFSFMEGEVSGRIDNSVSYGIAMRTQGADRNFAAETSGPNNFYTELGVRNVKTQANKNEGNLNFADPGDIVSNTLKWNGTLELTYDKFGAQISGFAFHDMALDDVAGSRGTDRDFINNIRSGDTFSNRRLTSEAAAYAVTDARLSSGYVWGDFELGDRTLNVRLGEQVLSWGEALFMQDGINQVNPADLSALRLPGAEIKDALLPLPMLVVSTNLTEALSAEAFYEFGWKRSEADPVGTFYSTTDAFFGLGSESVIVDLEGNSAEQLTEIYNFFHRGTPAGSAMASRLSNNKLPDVKPQDSGQFGLALRYLAESLNNTEFGFYFLNYHGRKPTAGAVLGESFGSATDADTCAATYAALAAIGVTPTSCANTLAILQGGGTAGRIVGGINAMHYIDSSNYFLEYQEDIQVYGLTFSTNVGETSLSGELAFRPDMPFLPEVGDNLIALNTLNARYLGNGQAIVDGGFGEHITQASITNNVGAAGLSAGDTISLVEESGAINLSLVGIHNFGPTWITDGLTFVAELGAAWMTDLDNKRYAAEGTLGIARACNSDGGGATVDNNPTNAGVCSMANMEVATVDVDSNGDGLSDADALVLVEGTDAQYLDEFAWGYRLVVVTDFNDVAAGLNLKPQLRFAHDVGGNGVVGGNFVEGRMSATIAVDAEYSSNWNFGVGTNVFWGAENRNQLKDRDNIYANVKYSF